MSSSITRFLLENPIGRKHTELFSLKKNSTFPLTSGEGVRVRLCFSAPWESFVLTPGDKKRRLHSGSLTASLAVPQGTSPASPPRLDICLIIYSFRNSLSPADTPRPLSRKDPLAWPRQPLPPTQPGSLFPVAQDTGVWY